MDALRGDRVPGGGTMRTAALLIALLAVDDDRTYRATVEFDNV